jgi:cytochrome P450
MWHAGHKPFAVTGADTLMAVSPTQNVMFTCDPKLITQLLREPAFGKPTALLGLLNVFGPTVTGTDGPEAKIYRKVVAPFFNQATMGRVFRESVEATGSLVQVVAGQSTSIDTELRLMLSKLALHILGKTGFDKEGPCLDELKSCEKPLSGFKFSFTEAFMGIDQDLPMIALVPPVLLKYFNPRGYTIRTEMEKHLSRMAEQKRISTSQINDNDKNLLDLLIGAGDKDHLLSEKQITGNIFILHFAGHESNAHVLQFALLNLACQPEMQKKVQSDIDRVFGNCPSQQWSYEQHYNALASSMVGAVINESLRVYTVLPVFMKETKDSPIPVTVNGHRHIIPPRTVIMINTNATHRNPAYWPNPTGTIVEGLPYAVSAFDPEQWFGKDGKFLVPEPGAFIPFSDGPRGCLGTRFAMAELCASLSVILKGHSIELAVSGDEGGDPADKKRRWQAARDNAIHQLSGGIQYNMTLRLGGKIPIRFTERPQRG